MWYKLEATPTPINEFAYIAAFKFFLKPNMHLCASDIKRHKIHTSKVVFGIATINFVRYYTVEHGSLGL